MSRWLNELIGEYLLRRSRDEMVYVSTTEALQKKRYLGLYFAARYYLPCRGFTPILEDFYVQLKEEYSNLLELVYVSSDSSESEFQEYFQRYTLFLSLSS